MKNIKNQIKQVAEKSTLTNSDKKETSIGTQTVISDKCPYRKCDGCGYYLVEKEDYELIMVECRCQKYRNIMRKIKTAGIPKLYEKSKVNDFDPNLYMDKEDIEIARHAKKAAIEFVKQFLEMQSLGKGLYFYSETKGSGKTHLAIGVTNALIANYDVCPLYISSVNLLSEIKRTYNQGSKTDTFDLINTFGKTEVLIIDDFGLEKTTEWSEEIITQIIEERLNNKRVTIITSNIPLEELTKKYPSGRIESRIYKMVFSVPLPEKSIRKLLAKKENDRIAEMFFNR